MSTSKISLGGGRYCYSGPNCRIHSVRSVEKARSVFLKALDKVAHSTDYTAMEQAKVDLEAAQKFYDATDEGQASLRDILYDVTDPIEKARINQRLADGQKKAADLEAEAKANNAEAENGLVKFILKNNHTYNVPVSTNPSETNENVDMFTPTFVGGKFDGNQTKDEIITNIRADIKEAQQKGYLPTGLKYSVTGKNGVRIEVQNCDPEQTHEQDSGYYDLTADGKELSKRLDIIANAYNNVTMHPQVDYFRQKYSTSVNLETKAGRIRRLEEKRVAERKRANKPVKDAFSKNMQENPIATLKDVEFTHQVGGVQVGRLGKSDIYVYEAFNRITQRNMIKAYDLSDVQTDSPEQYIIAEASKRNSSFERKNFLRMYAS